MEVTMFNTHTFIKQLTEAGMPAEQAEILANEHANLLHYRLATREDVKSVRTDLTKEIENVRTDLTRQIESMAKTLELRMTNRFGTMLVVAVGVLAIIIKLL